MKRQWWQDSEPRPAPVRTQAETAKILGVSRQRVQQIELRALRKLAADPVLRALFK